MAWETDQTPLNYLLRREIYYRKRYRRNLRNADDEKYIELIQIRWPQADRETILKVAADNLMWAEKFKKAAEIIAQYGGEELQ